MKRKLCKMVGLALMMVAVLVMFSVPVAVADSPVEMEGTYALQGRVNMYNLEGGRYKVDEAVVKCQTGTMIITSQVGDVLYGTLQLQNLMPVARVFQGVVGEAGRYTYFLGWVFSAGQVVTLRGRLIVRDGSIYGVRKVVVQGNDWNTDIFFSGKMRGVWSETE